MAECSNGAEKRVPGRPFKKGADPNRHPFGRVSQKRAAWMATFLNELASILGPKEAARIVAKKYRAGLPFFVGETHERLGGKVTQPVDATQNVTYRLIYDKSAGVEK